MSARRIEQDVVFTDPQFPLKIVRIPRHGSGPTQHGHAFHELVVILSGSGQHAVGEEVYSLGAGDVFVVLGDTLHGYPETDELSLINILFDPGRLGIPLADLGSVPGYHALFTVEPRLRPVQQFRNRLRLDAEQLGEVTGMVASAEEELKGQTRGYRFTAITCLMQLLSYLSRCYSRLAPDKTRPVTQISELLGYMERHVSEPLTVDDLMGVAHMSQTTLMRTFRQVVGRSPIDYLIHLRIAKARTLLRQTDLPVTEVGWEVGFTDSNYFARQFRKVTGMSPRAFRQQWARKQNG